MVRPLPRDPLATRPLYRQVRDLLVQDLAEGRWGPGEALPSEMELASLTGVSQGTVRKALDAMVIENLVVRRQGRGTFVARHDEERILFQFFKLVPDTGQPSFPDSQVLSTTSSVASPTEAQQLEIASDRLVLRIRRVRALAGSPKIVETVVLPEDLFPEIASTPLPNNLYAVYASRYGITVAHARERLKAITLESADAQALGVPPGQPALLINRVAISLDGRAVEWRVSRCLTDDYHYLSDLR